MNAFHFSPQGLKGIEISYKAVSVILFMEVQNTSQKIGILSPNQWVAAYWTNLKVVEIIMRGEKF